MPQRVKINSFFIKLEGSARMVFLGLEKLSILCIKGGRIHQVCSSGSRISDIIMTYEEQYKDE